MLNTLHAITCVNTAGNYRVLIHKNEREALEDVDEFYSSDLVGLTVAIVSHHSAVSDSEASSASESEAETGSDASADHDRQNGGDVRAAEGPHGIGAAVDGRCGQQEAELRFGEHTDELHRVADGDAATGAAGDGGGESWSRAHQEGGAVEEDGAEDAEEVVVALGKVVDVYDGTGTHGVLRIEFREGLQVMADGKLVELSEEEMRVAEVRCIAALGSGTRDAAGNPVAWL